MLKKPITNEEYLAALHFVQNCKQTYPELDLMEEDIQDCFNKSLNIITKHQDQINREQLKETKDIQSKKGLGKLQRFKAQALECLKLGDNGEFMELTLEVNRMKNEYARAKYSLMLSEAKREFQLYLQQINQR